MWPVKKWYIYILVAREWENLMDYVIKSCDLPKKEILMDYISNFLVFWSTNFLFRKFDGLCKQVMWPVKKMIYIYSGSWKTGDSDGLYNQITWPVKKWYIYIPVALEQAILMDDISKSCDLLQKEILMDCVSRVVDQWGDLGGKRNLT